MTFTNKTLTAPKFADLGFIADANGNEMLIFDLVASAVNELTIGNGATGNYPTISATGGDTNIGINFQGKGTGSYRFLATADRATAIAWLEDTSFGTNYIEVVAPGHRCDEQRDAYFAGDYRDTSCFRWSDWRGDRHDCECRRQ